MKLKIACIIVTYNRKVYLKRCLDAVNNQTIKLDAVYILDNASTDGTQEVIKEWGFYDCYKCGTLYKYILNSKNEGGAGGFYRGMKYAMLDNEYDALWVMDDDGQPDKNCLAYLLPLLGERDYIAPIVLSDVDHTSCSFVPNTSYVEFCKKADAHGLVEGWASPFNGILYSAKLIRKIGYPKKEMFIWGDEINYQLRAENAGFHRVTVVKAIHYHPIDRQTCIKIERTDGVYIVPIEADWKLYCAIRNRVYNLHLIYNPYVALKKAFEIYKAYKHYYILESRNRNQLIIKATLAGYFGYFGGLQKYLVKE